MPLYILTTHFEAAKGKSLPRAGDESGLMSVLSLFPHPQLHTRAESVARETMRRKSSR